MENMQPSAVEPAQSNHKAFIYSLIVIAVVVIAGAVIMMSGKDAMLNDDAMYQESDTVTEELATQSSSDELADIEADLSATDLSVLE